VWRQQLDGRCLRNASRPAKLRQRNSNFADQARQAATGHALCELRLLGTYAKVTYAAAMCKLDLVVSWRAALNQEGEKDETSFEDNKPGFPTGMSGVWALSIMQAPRSGPPVYILKHRSPRGNQVSRL